MKACCSVSVAPGAAWDNVDVAHAAVPAEEKKKKYKHLGQEKRKQLKAFFCDSASNSLQSTDCGRNAPVQEHMFPGDDKK